MIFFLVCFVLVGSFAVNIPYSRQSISRVSGRHKSVGPSPQYAPLFYSKLSQKIVESKSLGSCKIGLSEATISVDGLYVNPSVSPPLALYNSFVFVSDDMCISDGFRNYLEEYSYDKSHQYFVPTHPRYMTGIATEACKSAVSIPRSLASIYINTATPLPDLNLAPPFSVTTKAVIIANTGMAILPCGIFGYFGSCGAEKISMSLTLGLLKHVGGSTHVQQLLSPERPAVYITKMVNKRPLPHLISFPRHDYVFVVTQGDDTEIGQFILEVLPRLVFHLQFLESNPHVKIHYGFRVKIVSKVALSDFRSNVYFKWLGLNSSRIVSDTVIVEKEAYLPREGACQDAMYNAAEMVHMRTVLTQRVLDLPPVLAGHPFKANSRSLLFTPPRSSLDTASLDTVPPSSTRAPRSLSKQSFIVLISQRTAASVFVRNQRLSRQWTKSTVQRLKRSISNVLFASDLLQAEYDAFDILLYADDDEEVMQCAACQITMFSQANIVIGMHGAGLANTVYMKEGGLVVEVVPQFDSRHAPAVGIFARVSATMGLHHYSFYPSLPSQDSPLNSFDGNTTLHAALKDERAKYLRTIQLDTDYLAASILMILNTIA